LNGLYFVEITRNSFSSSKPKIFGPGQVFSFGGLQIRKLGFDLANGEEQTLIFSLLCTNVKEQVRKRSFFFSLRC
jgi:hypothetical protein